MPTVKAICISENKGEPKGPVQSTEFRENWGIEGDAHSGGGHRQISMLAVDDIQKARQVMPELTHGNFAENLVLSGLDFQKIGLGSRLKLGKSVVIRISQIGKECHNPCRIAKITGDCIMPRTGLFARVEKSGTVNVGDQIEVLETVSRQKFQTVVLTISDRCSKGEFTDTAGPAVAELLTKQLDAHIYQTEIIPDEKEMIIERLRHYCGGHSIDLVVTVGGTGFSPRDVTPEATREVIERPTPGLDEAMRASSLQKTPHAMLSRACCGILGATLIVNLPGSQKGATENIEAILPALSHGLMKLRGDPSDCGR